MASGEVKQELMEEEEMQPSTSGGSGKIEGEWRGLILIQMKNLMTASSRSIVRKQKFPNL